MGEIHLKMLSKRPTVHQVLCSAHLYCFLIPFTAPHPQSHDGGDLRRTRAVLIPVTLKLGTQ